MPSMGEKYVCGGHEFWCVGFIGSEAVLMRSGAVVTEAQAASFDKSLRHTGSMEVGGDFVAKETFAGVTAGEKYTVTGIDKGIISSSNGVTMDLNVFTAVFRDGAAMNIIGHEWLTYLGKESAIEEVKMMCLCAPYSTLRNAETMDSVFHDYLDTSSKDAQFLPNTSPQVQSPELRLECVGVSDGDEELDDFLRDKGYREKVYSNGYALLRTGESSPFTLTVYCGQNIQRLRNTLADGENLLDYLVYQASFNKARCANSSCLVSLFSDCVLTSVWVGRAEDIFL